MNLTREQLFPYLVTKMYLPHMKSHPEGLIYALGHGISFGPAGPVPL